MENKCVHFYNIVKILCGDERGQSGLVKERDCRLLKLRGFIQ